LGNPKDLRYSAIEFLSVVVFTASIHVFGRLDSFDPTTTARAEKARAIRGSRSRKTFVGVLLLLDVNFCR